MLLVALSRSSLLDQLESYSARQFSVGTDWLLTAVTDGFLSRIKVSDDEVVCSESLLSTSNGGSDVGFLTAHFSRVRQILEISKATISGRPVYYHLNSSGEFFASTHVCLLRGAGVAIEEDADVLPEMMIYRTVAPPRTLYRGIRHLPAAGRILVQLSEQGCALTVNNGYFPPDGIRQDHNEANIANRITDFLRDAVATLKPASQCVTTLLSGGVDSSILCRLAQQQLGAYDTYSSAYPFEDPARDFEKTYAFSAASALATRHSLFVATSQDFVVGVVEALAVAETPLDHLQSVLLHLLFQRAIPSRFDRLIHGAAAEAAWGTETHLMLSRSGTTRQHLLSMGPMHAALRVIGGLWPKAREVREMVDTIQRSGFPLSSPQNPLWKVGAYGDSDWVKKRYRVSDEDIVQARYSSMESFVNQPLNDVLSSYNFNFQVGTNIALWSKLAEGQHKILYYPFANKDLLDFAFSIPWNLKLRNPKHFLLETGRGLGIPEGILSRPKRSFGINSDRWSEKEGVLEPLISVAAKVVDIEELRALQGRASRPAMTLWSLLNYAVLKRLFVLGEPVDVLVNEVKENYLRMARH